MVLPSVKSFRQGARCAFDQVQDCRIELKTRPVVWAWFAASITLYLLSLTGNGAQERTRTSY
jgi:hypothetical protein